MGLLLTMLSAYCAAQRNLLPGDRIRIVCIDVTSMNVERSLGAGGFVSLPAVGLLNLATRTPEHAARRISMAIADAGLHPFPRVEVRPIATPGLPVQAIGQVGAPGAYPISPDSRLSTLVSWTSPTDAADMGAVRIYAADGAVSSWDFLGGQDPLLRSGDRVVFDRLDVSNEVIVIGGVGRPGAVSFVRGMTLAQAIAASGGLSPHGDPESIDVLRGSEVIPSLELPGSGSLLLRPGDTVRVRLVAQRRMISVVGAVARPGTVPFRNGLTLTQALELAGGLLPTAASERIIVRQVIGGLGKPKLFDLALIRTGRQGDPVLSVSDLVEVPFK